MTIILKIANSKRIVYTRFFPDKDDTPNNLRRSNRHYIEIFLRQNNVRELMEDCINNKESAVLTSENEINGRVAV